MKINGKWRVGLALLFTLTSACDLPDDGPKGKESTDAAAPSTKLDFENQDILLSMPLMLGKGGKCAKNSQCKSGFCVSGVCCSSACTEGCKTCALPSSLGECVFQRSGGYPQRTSFCKIDPRTTCGQDGTCDGNGGCRKYIKGDPCKPYNRECPGDSLVGGVACDGEGNCSLPMPEINCWPFTCGPYANECFDKCTRDSECAGGQKCVRGGCSFRLNGAKCDSASQCLSGHCADGMCCNVACTATCMSCNQQRSLGRCELEVKGTRDPVCTNKPSEGDYSFTGLCDDYGNCEQVLRAKPPGKAINISPKKDAKGVNTTATLTWQAATNTTSFEVRWENDEDSDWVTTKNTSITIGPLTPNTTYYWQVVALGSGGETVGDEWKFTTAQVSGKPQNPNPKMGATGVSRTPTFTWKAATNATSYEVQWGTADEDRMDYAFTEKTSFKPPYSLDANTLYSWKVVAWNGALKTESDKWKFTTKK